MDIWQIVMTPFSWLLRTFSQVFDSYAIALLLFTIIVKIILFPFSLKSKKSQIQMTMMNGKLQEIQKRCGDDKERYQQEVQKFYADNNINPMGGCGWSLIPILILWPLYAVIRRPLKYLMGLNDAATTAVANALGWTAIKGSEFAAGTGYNELTLATMMNSGNLGTAATAAGASTLFVINFNLFGIDLSQIPNWRFWANGVTWDSVGLFLLPVISAVLSVFSMIVMQKTNVMNKDQQVKTPSSWMMMVMQPVISLWIGFTLPAVLCIYWIANSLLLMIQEVICGKILKKDYIAAKKAMEEQAVKEKEEEKERRRLAAEKKAAALAASKSGKLKKVQPQAKNKGVDLTASREGIRAYARGRAYDPNRYPITPYRDPDDKYKKKEEEEKLEPLTEEEKDILRENGIAIPEETAVPAETEDTPGEAVQAPEEEAPVQEAPSADEDDGYEAPYADEEPKE